MNRAEDVECYSSAPCLSNPEETLFTSVSQLSFVRSDGCIVSDMKGQSSLD